MPTLPVDRYRHRPLTGDADRANALDGHQALGEHGANALSGRLPPLVWILLAAAVSGDDRIDRRRGLRNKLPAVGKDRHLRPAATEINGQHERRISSITHRHAWLPAGRTTSGEFSACCIAGR